MVRIIDRRRIDDASEANGNVLGSVWAKEAAAAAAANMSVQPREPTDAEYAALAEFRAALRRFLAFSEQAAAQLGLTMQWYQALLVIKTSQGGDHISVGELAQHLMIRDHSAAELVSRLVQAKLVRRKADLTDRRRSLLVLTAAGERNLARLASAHLARLREDKDAMLNLFR